MGACRVSGGGVLVRRDRWVCGGFRWTASCGIGRAGEHAGLRDELAEHARTADELAPEALAEASRRAKDSVRACASTPDTSFAGMNETFTNVRGPELLQRITDCWASLFGERVVSYRVVRQLFDEPAIAVVVQQTVASDRSGVMFTVDPALREQILIEAAFGLGEVVVSGRVEPDSYHVDRATAMLREVDRMPIGAHHRRPGRQRRQGARSGRRLASRTDRRRGRASRQPRPRHRAAPRQSAGHRMGVRRRRTVRRPVAPDDHPGAVDTRRIRDTDPAGPRGGRPSRIGTRADRRHRRMATSSPTATSSSPR